MALVDAGPALKVEIDVAEPRLLYDRLIIPVEGDSWEKRFGQNTYLEPLTKTMMLAPLPVTDGWDDNYSGNYARLSKDSYSLTTPDAWAETSLRGVAGDYWLANLGTTEAVVTGTTYPVNQPWYLALKLAQVASSSRKVALECGWYPNGGNPNTPGAISLRFLASGDVEVWRGTGSAQEQLATYDQQGAYYRTRTGDKAPSQFSLLGRVVNLMLIPCRGRDLIVSIDGIGGCVHTFTDILDGDPIVPAGRFWWRIGSGSGAVQCAPLRFATNGVAFGRVANFRYPPQTGRQFRQVAAFGQIGTGGTFNFGLVQPDNSGPFTPDGNSTACRLKLTLSGSGSSTPTVYSAEMVADPVLTTTYDAPFDVTPYLMNCELSVPENGTGTLKMVVKNPDKMEAAGAAKILVTSDRPVRASVGGVDIFRGTLAKPVPQYSPGRTRPLFCGFTGTDRNGIANLHTYVETFPYDGLNLTGEALPDVWLSSGVPPEMLNITPDAYELPFNPGVSRGEWALIPVQGDTSGKWRDKLTEDYIGTWVRSWGPGRESPFPYRWNCENPDTLPTEPATGLYLRTEDALAAGVAPQQAFRRVIRDMRPLGAEAESNQVVVTGQDPHTGQYLISQFDYPESQDPRTAPAARPDDWRGQVVRVLFSDPQITTQDAADRAADILSDRTFYARERMEIDCELLTYLTTPRVIWIGDLLRILQPGHTYADPGTRGVDFDEWRIVAIPSIKFEYEGDGTTARIRNCTYLLEKWEPA